ncbi:MAG: hypothetical protein PHU46_14955 [Rhodocyclaceae bacterium]|nr:hypothetical protein [Rhodocyclaceae bacterium]
MCNQYTGSDAVISLYEQLCKEAPKLDFWDHLLLNCSKKIGSQADSFLRRVNESKVIDGETFAKIVIPFSDPFHQPPEILALVNPSEVLAGAYNKKPELTDQEARNLADALDADTDVGGYASAMYVKIGPFNIYVAIEGKNRVSVYKRLNRHIQARVSHMSYPTPNELLLRPIKPWSSCFAVEYIGNDQKVLSRPIPRLAKCCVDPKIRLLAFPQSVSLLTSYGVSVGAPLYWLTAPLLIRRLRLIVANDYYQ